MKTATFKSCRSPHPFQEFSIFKKIIFTFIVLFVVLPLAFTQVSFADAGSFTINIPNVEGGYTPITLEQTDDGGFIGPQGEYYPQCPSVAQLEVIYGQNPPSSTIIYVTVAPPPLPVYVQPPPPDPYYFWTPGYWAYDNFFEDYYWVPGTWVRPPSVGLLWTPGYWYWRGGNFVFSEGYWGPHIGFYGGINYGHGYSGRGFSGGAWRGNVFISKTINVTNVTNVTNNYSSFNGGPGGVKANPTPQEKAAMKEKHFPATVTQKLQMKTARKNPALRASANHGKPPIAATAKPGIFKGKGVVPAKRAGAAYNRTKPIKSKKASAIHASVRPKIKKPILKKPVNKRPMPQKPIPPSAFNENNPAVKNT